MLSEIDTDLIMACAEIECLRAELANKQRMLNAAVADMTRIGNGGYNMCDVCIGKCYSYARGCDRFCWRGIEGGAE